MAEKNDRIGVSFELDIADLQKGLKQAKQSISMTTSEFQKSTAGMDSWQKKATGLAAKVNQLNSNLKTQDEVVKNVRKQYELTSKQYGENSDEAKKLLIQLNKEEATYKKIDKELKVYSKRLDEIRSTLKEVKIDTKDFDDAMSNLSNTITTGAKTAFKSLIGAIAGYAASLAGVAESTREYRTDLSKLESNAESAGVSLEVTEKALKDLNAITGETDSNIEALSNLMMAGFKDNNLQDAVDTLSDAVIKFPDTLKVESLADSLQESIKQMEMGNNATGQYAELLERLGYNLEDVTEATKKKKTLEEKQAYLLDLVNKKIGGTTKAYRDQNSELVDAADAQFELNDAMAELGEKAEPSISLVKTEVAGLVKELVKWIEKNVDLEEVTDDLIDGVKTFAKNVLPPLVDIIKNVLKTGEKLLPVIVATAGAIITYNTTVKLATALTKAYNVVTTAFKVGQVALAVALKGATTAQLGLNAAMKANVIGVVVTALGLLTAGVGYFIKKQKDKNEVTYKGIEADKKQIEAIKEEKEAIKDLEKVKDEQIANAEAEFGYLGTLKDELTGLIDTNGKVKKGYEDRASFILNELNEALGTELSLNDLTKQSIDEISASIDKLIAKQKAKIILSAMEESYTQAIQNQTKANNDLRIANDELMAAEHEKELAILQWQATVETGTKKEIEAAKKKMDSAMLEYDTKKEVYDGLDSTVKTYNENIADYEYLSGLIQSGNTEELQKELNKRASSYEENGKKVKLAIDDDIANEIYALGQKKILYDKDVKNGADKEKSKYKTQVEASEQRLKQLAGELSKQTSTTEKMTPEVKEAWRSLATQSKDVFDEQMKKLAPEQQQRIMEQAGVVEKDGKYVVDEFAYMSEDAVKAVNDSLPEMKAAGENVTEGLKEGIEIKASDPNWIRSVKGVANKVIKWWNEIFDEHSPSRVTRKMGRYLVEGLGLGIGDEENGLLKEVKSFGKDILNTFNNEIGTGLNQVRGSIQTSLDVNNGTSSRNASGSRTQVVNFYQTNNSPKPINDLEVYRKTKSILSVAKGGLKNV